MADLPEYKQRTKIEPAPIAEASSALRPLSKAWEGIAEIGAQTAQRQANEMAKISGAELGRTKPGLPLIPAFGETGAEFIKAYKNSEYATAVTKGTNYLDRLTFDTLKNPTSQNMRLYDEESQKYIEQIGAELTKENKALVTEQLQGAYLNSRYKIEAQLEDKIAKEDEGRFKATWSMFSEKIIEYIANNNHIEAEREYKRAEEYIDDPFTLPNLGLEAKRALKKSLKELSDDNKVSADILRRIDKGENVGKIIKSYADAPPTVQNLRKAKVAAETLQNYAAMTSAHDNLLISQAATQMIKQGGLSTADLAILKSQVTPNRFADFEVQVTKFMAGQKSKTDAADFMEAYANNSAMLKTLGGDALNKGYQVHLDREAAKLGRPLSIEDEARVAQKFDTSIPAFNAKLGGGINSHNPQLAGQYANLYSILARNNPNVVEGIDNTTAVKAEALNDALKYGSNPDDAHKEVNSGFNHLTPREVTDSKAAFQEQFNNTFGRGADTQFKNILKGFDYSNAARKNAPPPGLAIDFEKLAEANYVQSRDWDKSIEVARQKIAQRYMETEHNGVKQIQLLPPTKFLPLEDVRRLEAEYLQQLTAVQKEMVNNPEILAPFHYELDKDFTISGVGITDIVPGIAREATNTYRGTREGVNYKGEKIKEKGEFRFMSDQFTDYPAPGQLPSWSLMFYPDNKLAPDLVYAPLLNQDGEFIGTQNARFIIPPEEIANKNIIDKELMQHREAITNVIRKMAAQIGGQYEY